MSVMGARLVAQSGDWLMYSGSYSSHRFSPLTQLTPDNVAKLRPVWVYQPPGTGSVEATPVVAHGIMYVTSGPTMVAALDLRSGKTLWEWTRPIAASVLNLGFPRVNRGVAILNNTIYVGTLDGYLFALDAKAGVERWSVHVGENPAGHAITAAPLVVDGKVIVGIRGGEGSLVVMANRNGFYYALDRTNGEFIVGAPYANQTWAKGLDDKGRPIVIPDMEPSEQGRLVYPSLQGSTNWASPSYSPSTDMLYVPVREMGSIYYKTGVEYKPGTYYTGGSEKRLDEESWGAVRALDVKTGKPVRAFTLPSPPS